MNKLAEIYNPLSDTFLVMTQEETGRYHVYRQARSPEFLQAHGVHDGRFGFFSTKNPDYARQVFEERLVDEATLPMKNLTDYFYLGSRERFPLSYMKGRWNRLNTAFFEHTYDPSVFAYEICDTPRRKLYDFEDEYFGFPSKKRLTFKQVKKLVHQVSDDFCLSDEPEVSYRDHKIYENIFGTRRLIRAAAMVGLFPAIEFWRDQGLICKRIALHEMAHIITSEYFPDAISHGPHFAKVSAMLYDRYFGIDREKYFRLANDPRYRIFGPNPCGAEEVLSNPIFVSAEQSPISGIRHLSPQMQT